VHELSLAEAVVEIAERHARGRRVVKVELAVGHLRQVVPQALRLAFELLSDGTALQGAELAIEEVPARGVCRRCAAETGLDGFPLRCAACGHDELEIVAGEELRVQALECEDKITTEEVAHGR
jgi:hydrogenase nickel incorporation protein HypA/HybF